jgi:hypothetical protein
MPHFVVVLTHDTASIDILGTGCRPSAIFLKASPLDDRDGDQVFRQQDRHAQARSVIRIRRLNR